MADLKKPALEQALYIVRRAAEDARGYIERAQADAEQAIKLLAHDPAGPPLLRALDGAAHAEVTTMIVADPPFASYVGGGTTHAVVAGNHVSFPNCSPQTKLAAGKYRIILIIDKIDEPVPRDGAAHGA